MKNKLVIVSGASGTLGRAYMDYFSKKPKTKCIGISRRAMESTRPDDIIVDLLETKAVEVSIREISLKEVGEIIFIHPVGMFKFEAEGIPEWDKDEDGIDDEILASNIKTFENVFFPLLACVNKERRPIPITACAFGSLSDPYDIKYWRSYSRAKLKLRERMRIFAENSDGLVHSVFFEVSTVATDKERSLRPFADERYWLSTRELVARSIPYLEKATLWSEIKIYKPMPGFDHGYYNDLGAIREKWSREMGRELH
ncbi:MAG: hypothetical protein V4480_01750 [Patescibacteria group bacterium]